MFQAERNCAQVKDDCDGEANDLCRWRDPCSLTMYRCGGDLLGGKVGWLGVCDAEKERDREKRGGR